jgi:hypothetical protein
MGGSNGLDLFQVMATVNQVKPAPLVDAERAQHHVRDAAAVGTKQSFRLVGKFVNASQMFARVQGEIAAADRRGDPGWSDTLWGLATAREDSESDQGQLVDALLQGRYRASRGAFDKAGFEGRFGKGVGEAKMLDDLLDAPLVRR